jgi:hypothetical protein
MFDNTSDIIITDETDRNCETYDIATVGGSQGVSVFKEFNDRLATAPSDHVCQRGYGSRS